MRAAETHMERVASIGCCLCRHHRGATGLHGMGPKAFLRLFKLPTEYHLLGLVNRYLAEDRP